MFVPTAKRKIMFILSTLRLFVDNDKKKGFSNIFESDMITNVFVVVEDSEMGSAKVAQMTEEKWDFVDFLSLSLCHPTAN